jgi:hypothetical protein
MSIATIISIIPGIQFQNEIISFVGSGSSINTVDFVEWSFGDGSFQSGSVSSTSAVVHEYLSWGTKVVRFRVRDDLGNFSNYVNYNLQINPLPKIVFTGTLSAESDISFVDNSAPFYSSEVVSADWNFGDGSLSSTLNTNDTLIHAYSAVGSYQVTVSAFDDVGNVGINTTNIPIFTINNGSSLIELKEDYISLCGPKETSRYGASRKINLIEYLPNNLRDGEVENFLKFFEDFLNEMFDGLDGFVTSSTDVTVTEGYEDVNSGKPLNAEINWHRENTYNISGVEETDALNVQEIKIMNPENSSTEKISILEKIHRIAELHNPDLIDLKFIQFFANNLGYDIDISRDEVGISGSGELGTGDFGNNICGSSDNDKYLRFVISNLPTWYKIKTTKNAIKIMLYSFGLVGEIIEYYTNNYYPSNKSDRYNETGLWRLDYNNEFTDLPDGWFPTPHFAIVVDIEQSNIDIIDDIKKRQKIINAIESIRPINTVFRNLSAYVSRRTDIYIGSVANLRRYIKIESDGWANGYSGSPPEWNSDPL